jgi:SAM-dependent methyltransferase
VLLSDLEIYRNPRTGGRLRQVPAAAGGGEALAGDGDAYEVVRGIPRFCPRANYTDSFGFQWNRYDKVQLDSAAAWGNVSRRRLFEQTEWPSDLRGQRILEAGCGMGRFTQHLLAAGAEVWSIDSSAAIEANARNNRPQANLHLAQADINRLPFAPESFDRVLCIGVIQHTPDPRRAFHCLADALRPGGSLVVDAYVRLPWFKQMWLTKYWVLPITRRVSPTTLYRFCEWWVNRWWGVTGAFQRLTGRRILSWFLLIADYRGVYPLPDPIQKEWAILDSFDMLSPAYDFPQTVESVRSWYDEAALVDVEVGLGFNGVYGRGARPLPT